MKNKRNSLFLPLTLSFVILAGIAVIFGIVRYFILVTAWRFEWEALITVLWETLPALAAILILGLFSLIFLSVRVKKPLKKLRTSSEQLAERLQTHKEKPATFGAGCVGELSKTLVAEEDELASLIARVTEQTDGHATKREQCQAALRICETVAPGKLSFGSLTYGVQASIVHVPEVGADFCDGFALDKRRVFLAVGDVWERGLPAALYSARLLKELREKIVEGKTPAEALSALNASTLARGDGIAATLFCGVFDSISGELRYANAGHLPPVIAGERSGFLRMRAGTPLGLYADAQFTDEAYPLRPGQGLVLYTDGIVNAYNGKEYFGYDRLLAEVGKHYAVGLTADVVAEGIGSAVSEFGGEREDDAAVLSLFFPAGVQRLLSPQLTELNKMRELLDHWLQDDPRRKNIELACEEIFTNIVNHAKAKSIQISCEREESSLSIRFTDDGDPFNPLQVERGEKDFYAYAEGGMGMTIIRRIAGEIFYRTKQNMNVLTIRFPIIKGI